MAKSPFSRAAPAEGEAEMHDAVDSAACRDWNGNEARWDACGKGVGARRVSMGESVGRRSSVIASRLSLSDFRCADRDMEEVEQRVALLDGARLVDGAGEMARGTDS